MAFQDFDLISQRRQQERKAKIRKRIMIAVVSFVVILLIAAAAVCVVIYKNNEKLATEQNTKSPTPAAKPVNVAEKAVKSVCSTTDYKQSCEDSLLKAVKNNASAQPEDILRASFSVASVEIDKVIKQASAIKFDTPFKTAAFNDCLVLLKDAKEELNSSISSIKGKDLTKISAVKPELNNWLSAVMSYQQTCIDGFPDGPEKDSLKKMMKNVREFGSNALAIVSQVSSIFTAFKAAESHRRLMAVDEAGYPTWMDQDLRRELKADPAKFTPNATVAKDGSGNFTTINEALKAMPEKYTGRSLFPCFLSRFS